MKANSKARKYSINKQQSSNVALYSEEFFNQNMHSKVHARDFASKMLV